MQMQAILVSENHNWGTWKSLCRLISNLYQLKDLLRSYLPNVGIGCLKFYFWTWTCWTLGCGLAVCFSTISWSWIWNAIELIKKVKQRERIWLDTLLISILLSSFIVLSGWSIYQIVLLRHIFSLQLVAISLSLSLVFHGQPSLAWGEEYGRAWHQAIPKGNKDQV